MTIALTGSNTLLDVPHTSAKTLRYCQI